MHTHTDLKRLYYTANGVTPYILEQKVIISMQVYVQRMHILLGFLYTISLQRAEHQSLVHRLTVTRHLNNEYHVFSHTMTTHPQPYPSSEFSNWDVGMPGGINHVYHRSGHQCWGICCHGDNQCPVCTGQEDTSPAFHWEKHSERRVHGNHCLQTAEWLTLTNGCCCRYCNGTQHSRESLLSHRSLRIATYNMWNINSLERESYAERLHRLGQVWYIHIHRAITPHIFLYQHCLPFRNEFVTLIGVFAPVASPPMKYRLV